MGWAGIAFTVVLLLSAAMVTLPTGTMDGAQIAAFYAAHRELIIGQQLLGAVALVPFLVFVNALARQHWGAASRPTLECSRQRADRAHNRLERRSWRSVSRSVR